MLTVKNLKLTINTDKGAMQVVKGLSFEVQKGKVLGIVGESGAGKTMTALSILGLNNLMREVSGSVLYKGVDLLKNAGSYRGKEIALIMQSSDEALNPGLTIGEQMAECLPNGQSPVRLLQRVGITDPEKRLSNYPHQLSGGMKQRVAIAMAIALNPKLIIADEPTSGLDVTIQAQILELLKSIKADKQLSMILITHDLGVIAHLCDEVLVMYAGRMVEAGPVDRIFYHPVHPYTRGLLNSIGRMGSERRKRLRPINGFPPDLYQLNGGCCFAERCSDATAVCLKEIPLIKKEKNHSWACHLGDSC